MAAEAAAVHATGKCKPMWPFVTVSVVGDRGRCDVKKCELYAERADRLRELSNV